MTIHVGQVWRFRDTGALVRVTAHHPGLLAGGRSFPYVHYVVIANEERTVVAPERDFLAQFESVGEVVDWRTLLLTSVGIQLDELGADVVPRHGAETDDVYRQRLVRAVEWVLQLIR